MCILNCRPQFSLEEIDNIYNVNKEPNKDILAIEAVFEAEDKGRVHGPEGFRFEDAKALMIKVGKENYYKSIWDEYLTEIEKRSK